MTSPAAWMRRAIAEAKKGLGSTSPNPVVGAVLVKHGKLIATGYHAAAGTDHGEVAALRKVDFKAKGCDLYTTLEPCNHQGRTGPCTEAIIGAGVKRVFVGALDPNPLVAGGGIRRLTRAKITVESGILEARCAGLNEPYNHAIVKGRPFVVMKAAMSLDGRIATRTGHSKWITGEAARAEGRKLRRVLDAIVVGVETVLADDPQLTCREKGAKDPLRVILDSNLRTPPASGVARPGTVIFSARGAPAKRRSALEKKGVEVVTVKRGRTGVDVGRVLERLMARGINGVLVEGGSKIHGSFVDAGLVDKAVLFVAPMIVGGAEAKLAVAGRGAGKLSDALRLDRVETKTIDGDVMIVGYRT